jgi:hypothetical protein
MTEHRAGRPALFCHAAAILSTRRIWRVQWVHRADGQMSKPAPVLRRCM